MVVTRRAPAPAGSTNARTNASQTPARQKSRGVPPPDIALSDSDVAAAELIESMKKAKQKTKTKGRRAGRKAKHASGGFFDFIARMALLWFTIYTLSVCPEDDDLKSPVCRGLFHYRTLVLEPYVFPPLRRVANHPAVAPYIAAVKPTFDHAVAVATPAALQTRVFINERVVPQWNKRVVPQFNKHVVPQFNKHVVPQFNKHVVPQWNKHVLPHYEQHLAPHVHAARPYAERALLEYQTRLAPAAKMAAVQLDRAQRAAQPYVILAAHKTYEGYVAAKPYAAPLLARVQDILRDILVFLAARRREYVDPHVAQIWERVKEYSGGVEASVASGAAKAKTPLSSASAFGSASAVSASRSASARVSSMTSSAATKRRSASVGYVPVSASSAVSAASSVVASKASSVSAKVVPVTESAVASASEILPQVVESTSPNPYTTSSSVAEKVSASVVVAGSSVSSAASVASSGAASLAAAAARSTHSLKDAAAAATDAAAEAASSSSYKASAYAHSAAASASSLAAAAANSAHSAVDAAAEATASVADAATQAASSSSFKASATASSLADEAAHSTRSLKDAAATVAAAAADPVLEAMLSASSKAAAYMSSTSGTASSVAAAASSAVASEPEETNADHDVGGFLEDLGFSEDLTPLEAEYVEEEEAQSPAKPAETEEQIAERLAKVAAKRADITGRHTKWEAKLEAEVREQTVQLERALLASREAVAAALKTAPVIRGDVDELNAEAEKLLKGAEGYLKNLKREKRSDADKAPLWEKVVDKVEAKFVERMHQTEDVVNGWYDAVNQHEKEIVGQHALIVQQLGDTAQEDLGMDYIWLADVTYHDWQRYHDLMRRHQQFTDDAIALQNGTSVPPLRNEVQEGIEELEVEVAEVVAGFETRLRRLNRDGMRAFKGDAAAAALDGDEADAPEFSILPIPTDEPHPDAARNVPPVVIGRGQAEVREALGRVEAQEQTETIPAAKPDAAKSADELVGELAHEAEAEADPVGLKHTEL